MAAKEEGVSLRPCPLYSSSQIAQLYGRARRYELCIEQCEHHIQFWNSLEVNR